MARKKNALFGASVIIPAYNAQKTLPACLDALLVQSVLPNEIIVVDDGSTDETKTMAEAYSLVQVISQKNQGPAKARNVGAAAAKSEIIIFLDSDCVPEKNWVQEMLAPFSDEKVVGVQGAYKSKQTSLVARFDQLDIEYRYERMKRATKLDWIGSYSAAYVRKIFLHEKGFDESFPKASGEDAELSYRMAEKGRLLLFASNAIVYHTHPEKFWKFLNVEYFRAYWRMRMYIKHPVKAVRDSYTPQSLKLAVFFGLMFALSFTAKVISVFIPVITSSILPFIDGILVLCFVGIYFVNLHFLFFVLVRDWQVGLFSLVMFFARSISFALGVFAGFLDEKVRA